MSFLPIVERELRVAARRRGTYWLRSLLALAVLMIWFSLLIAGRSSVPMAQKGKMLFMANGILAFGFSLLAGVFLTADCLSEEKREGTLGLLFLTELEGYDVVLGKLIATSLHAFYGLLAILPLLGLPLLLGGVTAGEFWRMTVVLLATLFLSLALGMVVSALSNDTRQAMAATLAGLVILAGVLPLLWWLQRMLYRSASWDWLLWPSPAYLYSRTFDSFFRSRAGGEFWRSLLTILILGGGSLILASLYLPRAWHEKAEDSGATKISGGQQRRWRLGSVSFRRKRLRWLERNPFYWLASRDQRPKRLARLILGSLLPIWLAFVAGCFAVNRNTKDICFAVAVFMPYGLHQVLKSLMAIEASRRLSEDRHSGALELLLVTPLSVDAILAGQRQAFRETFRWPMALMCVVNAILLWLVTWANPMRMGDERIVFGEIFIGGALMLAVDSYAMNWVGIWVALRTSRPHRAVFATIARVMLPPWLGLLFFVFLGMAGVGWSTGDIMGLATLYFVAGLVLDLTLAARARIGLSQKLRDTSTPTYDLVGAFAPPRPALGLEGG